MKIYVETYRHEWFAWHPVIAEYERDGLRQHAVVWLEKIERMRKDYSFFGGYYYFLRNKQ